MKKRSKYRIGGRCPKICVDVKNLDIDLIDTVNPFSQAYSILSKTMTEERLKEVAALITGKKISLP